MISRDGSKTYAKAITEASSQIKQVGDIFHQLFEAVKKEIYYTLSAKWTTDKENTNHILKSKTTLNRKENEEKRWNRIQTVQSMVHGGKSILSIARELNVSRGTIYSDLKISSKPSHRRSSPYDKYRPLIQELVSKKLPSKRIEETCRSKGYIGSKSTLSKMIAEERKQESSGAVTLSLRQKALQIIWDFKEPDHINRIQELHPKLIQDFPELLKIDELVGSFHRLFLYKEPDGLRKWFLKY